MTLKRCLEVLDYIQSMGKPLKMERVLIQDYYECFLLGNAPRASLFGHVKAWSTGDRPVFRAPKMQIVYVCLPVQTAKGIPAVWRALVCASYPSVLVGKWSAK